MNQRTKKRLVVWTTAIVLIPVVALAIVSMMAKRPANLGVVDGRLAACPDSPNCVSTQADDAAHRMPPLPLGEPVAAAIERLATTLTALPRTKIVTRTDDYLHAEVTSRLFRFVDDVEIYVDSSAGQIHFRSASQTGHSDLGVNRARMQQISNAYSAP